MTTYFGNQTGAGADNWLADYTFWNPVNYTCPGTGNQYIQELSVYCHSAIGNIRLGIYSADGTTLIAEGTGEVALSNTLAWQGHMTQASVKAAGGSSPGILVGGTAYRILVTCDEAFDHVVVNNHGSGTWGAYKAGDNTAGMPASIPAPDGTSALESLIRCGVDPAKIIKILFPTQVIKINLGY